MLDLQSNLNAEKCGMLKSSPNLYKLLNIYTLTSASYSLKECLRLVNDTSSRVVGQAFFNVIEAPCFEFSFEEQCVERHWYGV